MNDETGDVSLRKDDSPLPRGVAVAAAMRAVRRVEGFTELVIREMTRLVEQHDAINFAQGSPDFPSPPVLKAAAIAAIKADVNQ